MSEFVYTPEHEKAVTEYVKTLPSGLHQHLEEFVRMKLPLEVVQAFVQTAKRTSDSWWVNAQDEQILEQMSGMKAATAEADVECVGNRHVTHVGVALTEQEKSALRVEYAGVTDLVFASDEAARRADHAYMYATRVISRAQLQRMMGAADVVVEVGAKVEHVVNAGPRVGTYYAVMPVLDAHDVQRHSPSRKLVELMLRRNGRTRLKEHQKEVARIFLNDFDAMFSRRKIQELTIACDTVLSQDANYDIPMEDAVAFMHRSGAKRWLGSMVRCDDAAIFVGRVKGEVENASFCYDVNADEDVIQFHFKSSAFPYKHKLSTYRPYQICNNREFVVEGSRYVYRQLPHTTATQLYFEFCLIPNLEYERTSRVYKPMQNQGMLRVHHPVAVLGSRGKFNMAYFDVPEEIFSRVVRDRLIAKDEDDGEIMRSIRASRVSVIVNGTRVSTEKTLAIEHVRALASVVKVYAAEMKRNGNELSLRARDVIAAGGVVRETVSSSFWGFVKDAVAGPGSLVYAIGDRLNKIQRELSGVDISVERLKMFQRMPDNEVVRLDEQQRFEPSMCYCEELRASEELLSGDCGGLSDVEFELLSKYTKVLKSAVCVKCEHAVHPFVRVVDEYSEALGRSDNVSDGSDYPCREKTGPADDSGYASSVDSTDLFEDACEYIVEMGSSDPDIPRGAGVVREAMEEYADVMRQQMICTKSEASKWMEVIHMAGFTQDNLLGMTDGRLTHYALEVKNGAIVGMRGDPGPDPQDFKVVFDLTARRWLDVARVGQGPARLPISCGDLVYTNTNFLIWNQPRLIEATRSMLDMHHLGPLRERIRFVDGIFGCGKTRNILKQWRDGDVYLTATSRSAETVRSKLYGDHPKGKQLVRTYDSALMHGVPVTQGTVYLDEMPMAHFGQVLALIEKAAGSDALVVACGDFQQINWIPFVAGFYPKFASGRALVDLTPLPVSHRCRASVVAAALRFYPIEYRIACCTCCEHILADEQALYAERVTSASQVPMVENVKYLTFTHKEQHEVNVMLQSHGLGGDVIDARSTGWCSTVHEVQGETFDNVVVVRLNNTVKPGTIYFSEQHVVTAISRAKYSTRYYSMSLERDSMIVAGEDAVNERLLAQVRANAKYHSDAGTSEKAFTNKL